MHSCEIMGFLGIIIQAILAAICFSVLIIKRYCEVPRRPWKIWLLVFSIGYIKNCFISSIIAFLKCFNCIPSQFLITYKQLMSMVFCKLIN